MNEQVEDLNYRVQIYSKKRSWHHKNIDSNVPYT